MSLETRVRMSGGVAVLDVEGRLVFGGEGDTLRETLIRLFEEGHRRILLNLSGLTHADSGGLGDLVAAYSAITRRGGAIKLVHPQPRILAMLHLTQIDTMFEICEDEAGAITSFQSGTVTQNQPALTDFLLE
jgi:anti-sigma B factor antagonist